VNGSETTAATPIIVVGMNRSGTKWISNILSNHPQVVSAQYDRGDGIQETNMLGAFPRAFGDLAVPDNYVGLIEWWAQTDFFRILGIEKEHLYRLDPRPRHPYDLFCCVMEEYARRKGGRFWLQKTSPHRGAACRAHYPEAHLVVIERDVVATLRSAIRLRMRRSGGRRAILREVVSFVHQEKLLGRLRGKPRVVELTYEALLADSSAESRRVCAALGLSYEPGMIEIPFRPNTSFRSAGERDATLTPAMERGIRVLRRLLGLLPVAFFGLLQRLRGRRYPGLVPGTHGMIKDDYRLD